MSAPEPVNEDDFKGQPEIRGGNRPADYIPDPSGHGELEVVIEEVDSDDGGEVPA